MESSRPTRRGFLALLASLPLALLAGARPARAAAAGRWEHPEPRSGIDASRVLAPDRLEGYEEAAPAYDAVRKIPRIADGIRCHCGCADLPGYRSLLSCFEEGGMAMHCEVCQGQALLAFRLYREGEDLDAIRRAIDARFAS